MGFILALCLTAEALSGCADYAQAALQYAEEARKAVEALEAVEAVEPVEENTLPMDPSVLKPWINSTVYGMVTEDNRPDIKDDLYLYVNHDWAESVQFRPGYSSEMRIFDAMDTVKERCMELLSDKELLNAEDPQVVHDASLIQGIYELFLDWDSRNEVGVTPFEPMVAKLLSVGTLEELTEYLLSEDNY